MDFMINILITEFKTFNVQVTDKNRSFLFPNQLKGTHALIVFVIVSFFFIKTAIPHNETYLVMSNGLTQKRTVDIQVSSFIVIVYTYFYYLIVITSF